MTAVATVPEALASPVVYRPAPDEHPVADRAQALSYLGYNGHKLREKLARRIEDMIAQTETELVPHGVRRAFAVDATGLDAQGNPCIRLVGSTVQLTGTDIYRHLKDADWCMLMAVTLGVESERRMTMLESQRMGDAVIFDAACSAYVEAACDVMGEQAMQQAHELGYGTNWRFSAGIGDCPIDAQPAILAALDAGRILGLTATDSCLLLPSKSITGMIGIFSDPQASTTKGPSCRLCHLLGNCVFRQRGVTCYGDPVTDD